MRNLSNIVALTAVLGLTFSPAVSSPKPKQLAISINDPSDGSEVGPEAVLRGTINDPAAQVTITVRPLGGPHWVQAPVNVAADGSWEAVAHFGDPGRHRNIKYEVFASANVGIPVHESQTLDDLPPAAARSSMLRVVRK